MGQIKSGKRSRKTEAEGNPDLLFVVSVKYSDLIGSLKVQSYFLEDLVHD